MAGQHIEQLGVLRGGRLCSHRSGRTRQQLHTAAMTGHEAFQQGTVQTVQVANRVSHTEQRLQVQVQRAMPEQSDVDQRRVAVGSVQRQSEIDRHRGRATATLGIDQREDLAADFFPPALAAERCVSRTNASSRSVVVVGRSTNSRAPARIAFTITCGCAMLPTANRADSGNSWCSSSSARSAGMWVVRRNIDQNHIGIGALHPAH